MRARLVTRLPTAILPRAPAWSSPWSAPSSSHALIDAAISAGVAEVEKRRTFSGPRSLSYRSITGPYERRGFVLVGGWGAGAWAMQLLTLVQGGGGRRATVGGGVAVGAAGCCSFGPYIFAIESFDPFEHGADVDIVFPLDQPLPHLVALRHVACGPGTRGPGTRKRSGQWAVGAVGQSLQSVP